MIPKIIHYCWLSAEPYPPEIARCILSWKEKLPGYEIRLWNTANFDINSVLWTREAFSKNEYAFVSDYIRFYALYAHGGIYLDSDVEVLKSFDCLLEYDTFFGYEYTGVPEAAIIGAAQKQEWLKNCLRWYESNSFLDRKGRQKRVVAPLVLKYGYEKTVPVKLLDTGSVAKHENHIILPNDWFSPKNGFSDTVTVTQNSYTIHHFKTAWLKRIIRVRIKRRIHLLLIKLLGKITYNRLMYKVRKDTKIV
ncbi:glycosyl transferase [Spirochaetia bacterium]|nr:glycosyl transferase [Spirochaetia bacterium]